MVAGQGERATTTVAGPVMAALGVLAAVLLLRAWATMLLLGELRMDGPSPNGREPEAQVRPGMHVRAGPTTFTVGAQRVAGHSIVLLHIEHAAGATILPIDPALARRLGRMLQEAGSNLAGGLVVPNPEEVPPG